MTPKPLDYTWHDVPVPPSANRLYRVTKDKKTGKPGRALTREHARWRKTFGDLMMARGKRPRFDGEWLVEIVLPAKCKKDPSNVVKATEDALVHFEICSDDYNAQGSNGRRGTVEYPNGGCQITVRSLRQNEGRGE